MTREEYLGFSKEYNLIPVWRELLVDLETPITIFKKVSPTGPAYLLESVEGGENLARYSFIGLDPFMVYRCRGEDGLLADGKGVREAGGSPLAVLKGLLERYRVPQLSELPRFYGGAVGYLGYDLVRLIEKLPDAAEDDLRLPDCLFVFAGTVLIFDHVRHTLKIVRNSLVDGDPGAAYDRAETVIEEITAALRRDLPGEKKSFKVAADVGLPEANMAREDFTGMVERAKEYIRAGDILQVVLSQRFRVPFKGDCFRVYRNLRAINPSPYLYYLDFRGTFPGLGEGPVIIGSSPEMLVRVEGDLAQTCPIAGTRPRGGNPEEDRALACELLADEKERAEHLMLVDLGRNDLGRVCTAGSVQVTRFMEVERYSHVMHLVSAVQGRLEPGRASFDALRACFPAGTVSGAPKVRAMEIIDEMEPTRRGIYAGAIGYLGFGGNMDTAITIRTVLLHEGYAYVQAGAGIVADSDPQREYQETVNKARALLNTLQGEEV
ncbi:MAG: anthranilate synthase component I [Peptococcaceae bacterium]|nr:MAG: anthranilate synthase component I [Peptococcaceae bacterium]